MKSSSCPFCGNVGKGLVPLWEKFDLGHLAPIHCVICGAKGPPCYSEIDSDDAVKQARNKWHEREMIIDEDAENNVGYIGLEMAKSRTALDVQIGGDHYKTAKIQPVQYIEANQLPFLEGCVVKRVTRHDKPTGKGKQDIEKAIHELQLLLELRYA